MAFLLGRNLAVCLPHLGGEVEAEQGQRALPWGGGGGAFGLTSFNPKGVSQGRWLEVEMSMGPGSLCLCEEGWLSWSGRAGRLFPKLLQGSEGDPTFQTFPNLGPNPGKKNNLKVIKCFTK